MAYELKHRPEDFTVIEQTNRSFTDSGSHLILSVTKRQYNTEDMIEALANHTPYDRDRFGYAGNKDRQAITTQYVSVQHAKPSHFKDLDLTDISITVEGWSDQPIGLGDLTGNTFDIHIRRVATDDINRRNSYVNYFDKQRFSEDNHIIGKHIVNDEYEAATNRLLDDDYHGPRINDHLEQHENDYITALRQLPDKILQLFVHAYQSQLWNRGVQRNTDELTANDDFPIIGFGTRPRNELEKTEIRTVMNEEDITPRSFIIRSIPDLSAEGTRRDVYKQIHDLRLSETDEGVQATFFLEKGSYATMAIKHLVDDVNPTT